MAGAAGSVLGGIGVIVMARRSMSASGTVPVNLVYALIAVQEILLIGLPTIFIWMRSTEAKEGLSKQLKRPDAYSLGLTILAAVSFALASILLIGLWMVFLQDVGITLPEQTDIPPPAGALGLAWAVITAAVIPAFCEELLFRGLLLRFLRRKRGNRFAVLVSGLIFAVLHFSFQGFAPLLLIGWLLAALAMRYDGIWLPIVFHAAYNALVLVINTMGRLPSANLVFFGAGVCIATTYLLFRNRREETWN